MTLTPSPRDADGRPLTSWWANANGHFFEQVRLEAGPMARSPFGGDKSLAQGTHLHRATRKQKAALLEADDL